LAYSIPVDNSDREFVSKLKQKHNARNTEQPEERLRIRDEQQEGGDCSGRLEWNSDQQETENEHPYKSELDGFEIPASQLQLGERRQVKALEDTELVMVDTVEKLEKVRDELNASSAFAVDLEVNFAIFVIFVIVFILIILYCLHYFICYHYC
uniref:t-SNARE coiled-coil homology domain-containing protein n=1 Tax=Anisakis simplex TaxID=6269 RepID=A0A0M3JF47_ANISI